MPAFERYDGPAFRVLRKYLRSEPSDVPLVRIISAEHGLITLAQPIADYDRRMNEERAREVRPSVLDDLSQLIRRQPVREVLVVVGQTYLLALSGIEQRLDGIPVRIAGETQGRKLGVLRSWLYGEDADHPDRRKHANRQKPQQLSLVPPAQMTFTVGGRQFTTSAEQVLEEAHKALASGNRHATRITRWFVPLDGQRVSPKWLVSQVSGSPTSAFQADAARSILDRLGIPMIDSHGGRA